MAEIHQAEAIGTPEKADIQRQLDQEQCLPMAKQLQVVYKRPLLTFRVLE
jgi:hypothetical protein